MSANIVDLLLNNQIKFPPRPKADFNILANRAFVREMETQIKPMRELMFNPGVRIQITDALDEVGFKGAPRNQDRRKNNRIQARRRKREHRPGKTVFLGLHDELDRRLEGRYYCPMPIVVTIPTRKKHKAVG